MTTTTTSTTDLMGGDKLINFDIGSDDPDLDIDDKVPGDDPVVKRGRGRPPKSEPLSRLAKAMEGQPKSQPAPSPANSDGEERKIKAGKITVIERLSKQLGAVGTGLRPTQFNSIQELDDEIEALNSDLNVKRGDKAVKKIAMMLMPLIEMVVDKLAPKDKLDLTTYRHLKDEVEDNWEMFEEAATHIAILNAGWFAVTPYHEFASCTYACAMSTNAKNQAYRARGIAPPVPHNSPNDDNDDDNTTETE